MKPQHLHWITSVQVPCTIFLLQCLHLKYLSIFCTEWTSLICKVSSVSLSVLSIGVSDNAGSWTGWTKVRTVINSFFSPDHTLTCKLVSVYTRPVKTRKICSRGVHLDAVKDLSSGSRNFPLVLPLFEDRNWITSYEMNKNAGNKSKHWAYFNLSVHVVRFPR